MKVNLKTLVVPLFLLLSYSSLTAQLSLSVVNIKNSSCAANGEVTLSASGGSPAGTTYRYRVLSYSGSYSYTAPSILQVNPTITSLPAGSYVFQVYDNSNTATTVNGTVSGNYKDPVFVLDSVIGESCPGTGKIYTSVTKGNDPFIYRIRPTSGTWSAGQATGAFLSLNAGTYDVQIEDSCNVIKTLLSIPVGVKNGDLRWPTITGGFGVRNVAWPLIQRNGCTGYGDIGIYYTDYSYTAHYNFYDATGQLVNDYSTGTSFQALSAIGGTAPYTYTLTSTSGLNISQSTPKFTNVPLSGTMTYSVSDACGRVMSVSFSGSPLPIGKRWNNNLNCQTGVRDISIFSYSDGPLSKAIDPNFSLSSTWKAQYFSTYGIAWNPPSQMIAGTFPETFTVLSGNGVPFAVLTYKYLSEQSPKPTYSNLDPNSTYVIREADACGQYLDETLPPPAGLPALNLDLNYQSVSCPSSNFPVRYSFDNAPNMNLQFMEPIQLTVISATGGYQWSNYNGPISYIYEWLQVQFNSTYTVTVLGMCSGQRDTLTFTSPAGPSFTYSIDQPCSSTANGSMSITVTNPTVIAGLGNSGFRIQLFSGLPGTQASTATPLYTANAFNLTSSFSITGLASGNYTLILREVEATTWGTGCGLQQAVVIPTYVQPTAVASMTPSCSGAQGVAKVTNVYNGKAPYQYQIRTQGPPPGTFSAFQSSPTFTGLAPGNYDIRVQDNCLNTTLVSVTIGPLLSPVIDGNINVCTGSTLQVGATKLDNVTYAWEKDGVSLPYITEKFEIPNAQSSDAGTYKVKITDLNVPSCPAVEATANVTVSTPVKQATIVPAGKQFFCEGQTINLTGGPSGATGSAPYFGWSYISGTTALGSVNSLPQFSPNKTTAAVTLTGALPTITTSGTTAPHIVQWQINDGVCWSNKRDTINIIRPSTPVIGENTDLCEQTTSNLRVSTAPATGYAGLWTQISGPNVTIADPTAYSTTISGLSWPTTGTAASTDYVFRWKLYSTANSDVCAITTDVTIRDYRKPATAYAGTDKNICDTNPNVAGVTVTMNGTNINYGTGAWTISQSPSGVPLPIISSLNSATSSVTFYSPGIYKLVWLVRNGPCTLSSDTVQIKVVTIFAGYDQSVCLPIANLALNGSTVTSLPGATGTWTISPSSPVQTSVTFSPDNNTRDATVTGFSAGTYIFRWTIDDGLGCTTYDEVKYILSDKPYKPNAGADQNLTCANSATLNATINPADAGALLSWRKISGPGSPAFSAQSSLSTNVTNMVAGVYAFEFSVISGACVPALDTVLVTIGTTLPTLQFNGVTKLTCPANHDGIISMSASGGSGNYQFSIDGGTNWQASGLFTGLVTGNYTLMARDQANPTACVVSYLSNPVTVGTNYCQENCSNGFDDDGDGLTDCNDVTDCKPSAASAVTASTNPVCAGTAVTYTATPGAGGAAVVSWMWNLPAGAVIIAGAGTSSIKVVYSAAATGNVCATAVSATGCQSDTACTSVTVTPLPVITPVKH